MDLGLRNKNVIVVGATRGIGRAIAECFAGEGANVAFCARNSAMVKQAVADLKKKGAPEVYGESVDVADTNAFGDWIRSTAEFFDGAHAYVWNVSAQSFDWRQSCEVDLLSCVAGVDAVVPLLERSGAGSIVAIASQAALVSVPSYKAYSAVKAGLISYMSSLSVELAPRGIRVNTVSPSEIYFAGGFWERIKTEDPQLYASALAKNPFGRFGTPEEVARAVLFLSSPAASFISGTNLLVDGASKQHVQF